MDPEATHPSIPEISVLIHVPVRGEGVWKRTTHNRNLAECIYAYELERKAREDAVQHLICDRVANSIDLCSITKLALDKCRLACPDVDTVQGGADNEIAV